MCCAEESVRLTWPATGRDLGVPPAVSAQATTNARRCSQLLCYWRRARPREAGAKRTAANQSPHQRKDTVGRPAPGFGSVLRRKNADFRKAGLAAGGSCEGGLDVVSCHRLRSEVMGMALPPTVEWLPDEPAVRIIDQTLLPGELKQITLQSVDQVAEAIQVLRVRGAPAIGCAAAAGMALAAALSDADCLGEVQEALAHAHDTLAGTRPTAVNLFWALERMRTIWQGWQGDCTSLRLALSAEAQAIIDDDLERCRAIGRHGAELMPDDGNVLTHCNAGALATAGYGTALGVIRGAVEQGKRLHVWVDETRPLLQGARLTAFELSADGIPCTVICDNMAASLMAAGRVDCVVVGADRIAANGDVANKIGTYGLAVLCHHHNVPFYVAAPMSTVDLSLPDGSAIPIEQRKREEIEWLAGFGKQAVVPQAAATYNPAFDVTPAELITAIVTEKGIARPPYEQALRELAG